MIKSAQKLAFSLAVITLVSLFFLIIFGANGLLDLNRRLKERNSRSAANMEVKKQIMDLKRVILRLKSEPEFIEYTIRKDLKLVGPDDLVINIKKPRSYNPMTPAPDNKKP